MVANIDVLRPSQYHWVIRQMYCPTAVLMYGYRLNYNLGYMNLDVCLTIS